MCNKSNEITIWSDEEDQYLISNIGKRGINSISLFLNKNNIDTYTIYLDLKEHNNIVIKSFISSSFDFDREKFSYFIENFSKASKNDLLKNTEKSWKTLIKKSHLFGLVRERKELDNTLIEIFVKDVLNSLKIKFEEQVYIYHKDDNKHRRYFIADFVIGKTIIEVNGDYWHGNPLVFKQENLDKRQLEKVGKDAYKKLKLEQLGYSVIYIWEYDIKHNKDKVIEDIKNIFAS